MAATRTQKDDAQLTVHPWTTKLALRAAGADPAQPVKAQRAKVVAAVAEGKLPPEAVRLLRRDGWIPKR